MNPYYDFNLNALFLCGKVFIKYFIKREKQLLRFMNARIMIK